MLVIILLVQGIYSLVSNYATNDCLPENSGNDSICHRSFINDFSVANKFKHHGLFEIQSWVNLASMLVVITSLHYYRIYQKRSAEEIDRDNISPSDYTIMISKLPKGKYDEKLVENTVMEFWNRVPHEEGESKNIITKIVLAYNISEYVMLCREKKKYFVEKRRADHKKEKHGKLPKKYNELEINRKLVVLEEKIQTIKDEAKVGIASKTCGVAFVSFKTQKSFI